MPGHRIVSLAIGVFAFCFPFGSAKAQYVTGSHARQLVTHDIDEGKRVELRGNTRPEAKAENDQGAVSDDTLLEHMLLQLRRPEEKEEELQEYLEDLQEPGSRHYHHWLSAHEFGERFGPSDRDLDKITDWLEHHHFQINVVYPSGMVIDFTGTAGQVRKAFHTEIHEIVVKGEKHHANMSNPQIPAGLSSLVVGIVSLHDFLPHAMHQMHQPKNQFTAPNPLGGTDFAMAPADLATIYNLNPLFSAGNSGQGQTIALIEDTDVFTLADWNSFRSAFGLSGYTAGTISASHPAPPSGTNNCKAPGVIAPNDAEAILDGEWASAAAPSAAIKMVSCKDTNTTFGGLIAVQNLLNSKAGPPPIMSISYGQCEAVNGAAANAAYNSAYKQAVAEGVSVFVAAGDSGAAGCDNSVSAATSGIAVNAFASTPYNVAVGGTDFSDTYSGTNSSYWNSTNTSTFGSAISYIPEIPWNDSCAGALVSNFEGFSPTYGSTSLCNDPNIGPFLQTTVAGGGGPSGCATGTPSVKGVVSGTCKGWAKPSWQSVLGNPHDGVRDTPDVSLFAADGLWGHFYVFCWSDVANGGAACTGDPSNWTGAGGTSFASPIMAGIQALINQRAGARQGNPNPTYYKLAADEYGTSGSSSCDSSIGTSTGSACVFYDVTLGDVDVNCTGTHNCYLPSGTAGVLSTSSTSFAPAYGTSTGWDFATGIGSVNATNLVNNWPGVAPIQGFNLSAVPGSLTLVQGSSGSSTVTVSTFGGFSGSVSLTASGLPGGVTASFSPASTTGTSTLTLTAGKTAATGTGTVTITGTSGSLTNSTTISLTVNGAPDFSLSAAPGSISLTQGSSGASIITVTPQNGFTGSANLSVSGMPSGVNASLSPSSTSGTSTLTLAASSTATTGGFTITVTATSGSLTHTVSVTLTVTMAANPLPQGWWDGDVGVVGPAGSASYSNGTFTINASGLSIWNNADGMNFAYQPLSGDGTIIARLLGISGGTTTESTGVMIRESLDPSSTHAYELFGQSAIWTVFRAATGGPTNGQSSGAVTLPYWVKLVRSGNNFNGYASPDGINWTQVGPTQIIAMAQNVYIGLAVSSNTNSALAIATFDHVSISNAANPAPSITSVSPAGGPVGTQVVITGTAFGATQGGSTVTLNGMPLTVNSWSATSITATIPSGATTGPIIVTVSPSLISSNPVTFTVSLGPLPSSWSDLDIGPVGPAGSAGYSSGTFTVNASGQYIWSTADGMNFAYQSLSTDGSIIARLLSISGGASSESTGVMIRETLDPSSTHMYAAFGQGGILDVYRSTTAGNTNFASISSITLPYWVKVVRSGNNFSGYGSPDGVNWTQIGPTQTITMAQNVFIGLAVSSNTNSALATATFDNVSITSVTVPVPNITSISPASGPVGTTVTITGSGFGSSQNGSVVTLSGTSMQVNTWSDTSITANVPSTGTTGPIVVSVAPTMTNSNPVTFTVLAQGLPSPWQDLDIGAIGFHGSASAVNGTFTVQASGNWIWNIADGFNYAYQPWSGDGTVIARLTGLQGGSSSQSTGVMIRETLDPDSANAYAAFASGSMIYFTERPSTGANSTFQTNSVVISFPYWVKLTRSGDNFSVYSSTDGSNWMQIGTTQTIPMAQNVFVGLAVCADNNSVLATATFDNVTVQ
ncbi:MAG TPA: protease pro-enzyme activation domain-containing protein [Candidatus Acidoferrum sp.]|nr:protease pro-enzyme activation domain-containing protein [Candidatus Acidoferrum sp.]